MGTFLLNFALILSLFPIVFPFGGDQSLLRCPCVAKKATAKVPFPTNFRYIAKFGCIFVPTSPKFIGAQTKDTDNSSCASRIYASCNLSRLSVHFALIFPIDAIALLQSLNTRQCNISLAPRQDSYPYLISSPFILEDSLHLLQYDTKETALEASLLVE